jgi:hypothetical protein
MNGSLSGHVAIVAGATREAGRAIAVELGAAGVTVYCSGPSTRPPRSGMDRPETIEEMAERVTAAGGRRIAVRADHMVPAEVERLVTQVRPSGNGTYARSTPALAISPSRYSPRSGAALNSAHTVLPMLRTVTPCLVAIARTSARPRPCSGSGPDADTGPPQSEPSVTSNRTRDWSTSSRTLTTVPAWRTALATSWSRREPRADTRRAGAIRGTSPRPGNGLPTPNAARAERIARRPRPPLACPPTLPFRGTYLRLAGSHLRPSGTPWRRDAVVRGLWADELRPLAPGHGTDGRSQLIW